MARFARLIVPWRVYEYPGERRMVASVCGIDDLYAKNLFNPSFPLPLKHAERLAQYLEQHASECEALAREMRAYEKNRRSGNKKC